MGNSKFYSVPQILNDAHYDGSNGTSNDTIKLVNHTSLTFITGVASYTWNAQDALSADNAWIDVRDYDSIHLCANFTSMSGAATSAILGFNISYDGLNALAQLTSGMWGYGANAYGAFSQYSAFIINCGGGVSSDALNKSVRAGTYLNVTHRPGMVPPYVKPGIQYSAGTMTAGTITWNLYGRKY
jgi:hypothetical protein